MLAQIKGSDVTVTVASAVRDRGGFLTVSGDVQNTGSGIWIASDWQSDERELKKNGGSLAGATIVDATVKKKYLVLRDTTGRCLCTKFEGGVDEGKTVEWYAQFPAPPEESKKVELQIGTMPPATIEISEG
ncbi:Secreted protein [Streptomyces griseus]|uniref:Secreted protein n=1 Tax=Streptomyces griseus TaxID=1911 RepID=A0A380PB40_STRGR|nr:Secreted protein [Streptomyces griseus]